MAGNDTQKQLLSLIRDFASEKSHGERQIANLKKRIEELRSKLTGANAELEEAKLIKESAEQEVKGYEVELTMNEASIQTLEARNACVQDEISVLGSDLDALQNEGGAKRDDFIKKMLEINACIRKFQESVASAPNEDSSGTTSSIGEACKFPKTHDVEVAQRDLESKLAQTISHTNFEEQVYQTEQNVYNLVEQELNDLEKKASLMERIMRETTELGELTRQTSEWEETCASFSEELQRRFQCPSCHHDNSDVLVGLLQTSGRT